MMLFGNVSVIFFPARKTPSTRHTRRSNDVKCEVYVTAIN